MLTRRLRQLRAASGDAGVTLIEVLVGMGLVTIIGTLALRFFVSTTMQSGTTTATSFTASTARVAMRNIVTSLSLADTPTSQPGYPTGRFDTITASQVVFYSNVTNNRPVNSTPTNRTPPAKIVIQATGGQLIESTYFPLSDTVPATYASNYSSTPSSSVVIVPILTNTDVFTYYSSTVAANGTFTTTTTATSVASVGVKIVVASDRGGETQTLQSTVAITGALS